MRIFAPSPSLLSGVGGRGLAPLHHRFEFQIFARATRVERAARTNFRMFLPAYALSFVSPPPPLCSSIYPPPRSTISSGFYLWRHRLRIGIDSVIYSRTDRLSPRPAARYRPERTIERERLARNRILSKTGFSFESLFLSLRLSP